MVMMTGISFLFYSFLTFINLLFIVNNKSNVFPESISNLSK